MSEELLKIADGLLAVSEGVRALAGKAHSCTTAMATVVWQQDLETSRS